MTELEKTSLQRELDSVANLEDLDRLLERCGGISMSDDMFEMFMKAYQSRGWRLPQ